MKKTQTFQWFMATPVLLVLALLTVVLFAVWDFGQKIIHGFKKIGYVIRWIVFALVEEIFSDVINTMKALTGNS